MLCKAVEDYIAAAKGYPFFYLVGDNDYPEVLQQLMQRGLHKICISDFCGKQDKFPSLVDFIFTLQTSDVDYKDNKFVVLGLGEYLAVKGVDYAIKELNKVKDITLGNARVVFLLRGIAKEAAEIFSTDKHISERNLYYVHEPLITNLSITNVAIKGMKDTIDGIKGFLQACEDGASVNCRVSTGLDLSQSIIPVEQISDSYSAIKLYINAFYPLQENGTMEQWDRFLGDYEKAQHSLTTVFEKYDISYADDDYYEKICGLEYKNWLYFICLKQNVKKLCNSYLKYVVEHTEKFEDFKQNVLCAILGLKHTDKNFTKLYSERKKIVKEFSESDIAVFAQKNDKDPAESIYHLTNNTLCERKAIISWIATYGWNDCISEIYPELDAYRQKYVFATKHMPKELTAYFDQYKRQKLENRIDTDFLSLVTIYAKDYAYAKFKTRDTIINAIQDKEHTHLHWIDALGVEYLSFIVENARKRGLSIHVDIARADIPTITGLNKKFYDEWQGLQKTKEERLDQIKHKEQGGYVYKDGEGAVHLAAELQVIADSIQYAATELSLHHCKQFVIASDHGASRLPVIKGQDEKYETDTKGEHSGRCCKTFEGCDLEYYVQENGFFALSDYGRFQGSRKANVEVHGGATLEEIVVPIITLTLKNQSAEISLVDEKNIVIEKGKGVCVKVYISDVTNKNNIALRMDETSYPGEALDEHHFMFRITEIKRAKTYTAIVFEGEDPLGEISFTPKSKINTDFDDLFGGN